MYFFFIYVLSLAVPEIFGFNFDVNHAIIYENPYPFDADNYFGYTSILYPGEEDSSKPWIQIAAPKGMDPSVDNINCGIIFRCGIGGVCYTLYVHNFVNQRTSVRDYGWLGNAMDIDLNSKKIVVCAYRWLNIAKDEYSTYKVRGKCFWSTANDGHFYSLNPLENSNISFSAVGQAGFSAHMSKSKLEPEIVLGVPGIYNWHGTTAIYRNYKAFMSSNRPPIGMRLNVNKEFDELNVIPPSDTLFFAFDLLGYSVSSGYFFGPDEIFYCAGAPRSNRYLGQVFVFKYSHQHIIRSYKLLSAIDPQFGEYFGSSIAVGDFNNDGYDDLLVGAPFYTIKGYNQGRVLLYLGSKDGNFLTPVQSAIYGKLSGGQFGHATSVLGDIDMDGFCDFAVAAPFADDGRGIVYIYRGSRSGLNTEPSQVLKARDIDDKLRSFGSSFSNTADIDRNHFDDVAVGAYKSGHTVLLRCKPIISLKQNVTSSPEKLNFSTRMLNIKHCIWYAGSFLPNKTNIIRNFTLDPSYQRATFNQENPRNIQLTAEQIYCDESVIILKNTTTFLPMVIITDVTLVEEIVHKNVVYVRDGNANLDTFCSKCPVFNKHSSDVHNRLEIPFSIGCGNDNICRTDLEINYTFEDVLDNTFVIGANSNLLNLLVKIRNAGEKALKTELDIALPKLVYFANGDQREIRNKTIQIANALHENELKELIISFDMSEVNLGNHQLDFLNFSINLRTLSVIIDLKKTKKIATLIIQRDADIYLRGISEEQSYSFGNFSQGYVNITQIYTVQKYGPSPIRASRLFIQIPTEIVLTTNKTVEILHLLRGERDEIGLSCQTNITTIKEISKSQQVNNTETPLLENSELVEEATEAPRKLLKRHTNGTANKTFIDYFDNSNVSYLKNPIFPLNCDNLHVHCEEIVCDVDKLVGQQNTALFRLKMMLNIGIIKDLFPHNINAVLLSTSGDVFIIDPLLNYKQSDNRTDATTISTLILAPQPIYSVPPWIIIISVIGGLFLLMFLIIFLSKVGFFQRNKRDELEELKKNLDTLSSSVAQDNKLTKILPSLTQCR